MSQAFNKKIYPINKFYTFCEENFRTKKYQRKALQKGLIDEEFVRRILLVVTEVNGCELCTYGHTDHALRQGMVPDDIQNMLSGSLDNVPKEESVALFFAQHYADKAGNPSKESWRRIIDTYGEEKALGILSSVRNIMVGNTIGIALGALKFRFAGKSVDKTNLAYELAMVLCLLPIMLSSAITGGFKSLFNRPLL